MSSINLSALTVGVIGLGIIGSRVANRLREAGYEVYVWNRSPRAEPNFLASPAEVAAAVDVVQLFVSDGAALLDVVRSMEPSLSPRHTILNHATVAPSDVCQAGARIAKNNAQFLDAPFTGSRDAAAAGELVYYIGGAHDTLEMVRPILSVSARTILEIGKIGEASLVKIATNLVSGATIQALAEALALLQKNGVPLQYFADAIRFNAVNSGTAGMKLPCMLSGDFEPRFSIKNTLKDADLALQVAQKAKIHLPVCTGTAEALRGCIKKGWTDLDCSALAKQYDIPS